MRRNCLISILEIQGTKKMLPQQAVIGEQAFTGLVPGYEIIYLSKVFMRGFHLL